MKRRRHRNAILFFFLVTTVTSFLIDSSSAFLPPLLLRSMMRPQTMLLVNIAAELVLKERESEESEEIKKRLSRPERKALERARKQRKNRKPRKHNFAARKTVLRDQQQPGEGRYDLHSSEIPQLSNNSTADDVMRSIKRAQNLHDAHDILAIERFLLEQTDASFAYGYRGSLLARLAVAALHMNNHRLARHALAVRRTEHAASRMPMESAAIIRGLLRVHNVSDALEILEEELSVPGGDLTEPSNRDRIKHRALSLASIASRHFFEGEPAMAVAACRRLAALGIAVNQAELTADELNVPWARILRGAAQCQSELRRSRPTVEPNGSGINGDTRTDPLPCNVVYAVLTAMTNFPSTNSDRVYELLSNALVRRVVFVTGAVNMDGCPAADRGEAAFIGRSNVGKSSLVNMITNRKSLAYTSKRPGKTQQFNYFAVNDKPGLEKEIKYGDNVEGERDADSFYIVDLPGFGYAKVPERQRQQWKKFMHEYLSSRPTLRVVFHLIDGRHGPTEEDASIMKQVSQDLPSRATYVVVLTKADKNVKGANTKNAGKVSVDVMNEVQRIIEESGLPIRTAVVPTSAETKLGRDEMWRYLKVAAT